MSASELAGPPNGVVRARVYRYDPAADQEPRYDTFVVPHEPRMRVLDVLERIVEMEGEDLGYRWFCGVARCGTCAIAINGTPGLACWEPAVPELTLEPLPNLPVVRDLVTDRAPYDALLAVLEPLLIRKDPYPGFPEPLTAGAMAAGEPVRDCIQCLSCQAGCPVLRQPGAAFAGPAPLVQLAELALDPRDAGARGRLAGVRAAVHQCVSCYACEAVCPMEIPIVSRAIEPLKRQAADGPEAGARHIRTFVRVVRDRGFLDAPRLVLRARGWRAASLRGLRAGLRLALRGKVRPLRSLFGPPDGAATELARLFAATTDGEPEERR